MFAIELWNVTKRYGPVTAVDDATLRVAPGQAVALLGPNGAGKSTLVRIVLGLSPADAGRVRVFGHDPGSLAARLRIGTILQQGAVPAMLTAREHIQLFRTYYPDPMPFDAIVEAAGLAGLENKRYGQLSGGQKQRVLFALAICGRPGLLILDEPSAALDSLSRRGIWENIRKFLRGGGSLLLTTHFFEEAEALANRIVVLRRGAIAADTTAAELKQSPEGPRSLEDAVAALEVAQ